MRFLLVFMTFSLAFLSGCSKPDPNPELKDEIFQDLNSQLAEVTRAAAEEEKKLAENEKALKEVEPQTGQIKFAQKRVFDSQTKITRLKQEKQWLELRIEERKAYTKKTYLKAFKNKEIWPDPAEFEEYKINKKLRAAKREWDVKDRIEKANPGKGKAGKEAKEGGGEGGEKKPEGGH